MLLRTTLLILAALVGSVVTLEVSDLSKGDGPFSVPTLTLENVISAIDEGQSVIFVDTREPEEFAEGHIPGAINIPLRDVNPDDFQRMGLQDADMVIPYCMKDFRGYEVARRFSETGLTNVVLIDEHGLNAWRDLGLGVAR